MNNINGVIDSIKTGAATAMKTVGNGINNAVGSTVDAISPSLNSNDEIMPHNENLMGISGGNGTNRNVEPGFKINQAIKQAGAASQYARKAMDLAKEADSLLKQLQRGGMNGGKRRRTRRRNSKKGGRRVSRNSRKSNRRRSGRNSVKSNVKCNRVGCILRKKKVNRTHKSKRRNRKNSNRRNSNRRNNNRVRR